MLIDTTGARLRAARTARGWSQEELADRAKVNKATVSRLESGARHGSVRVLQALARALGLRVSDLIEDDLAAAPAPLTVSETAPVIGEVLQLLAMRFGTLPPEGQRRVLRVIRAILE